MKHVVCVLKYFYVIKDKINDFVKYNYLGYEGIPVSKLVWHTSIPSIQSAGCCGPYTHLRTIDYQM
jgi:hypothetical protein